MHANIKNNEIIDFNSKYLNEDITRVETTQAMYELYKEDKRAVMFQNGEVVANPEYSNILAEEEKSQQIENLKQQLRELDLKSIRAIRANETEYLNTYEAQVLELRAQLTELGVEDDNGGL